MVTTRKIKRATKIIYYKGLTKFLDPKVLELDPYERQKLKQILTQIAPGNSEAAVNLRVVGKINGVGYKEWLRRRANIKELNYWSRTVAKNEVEILLIGDASNIEDVIRSSWRGPKNAEVKKVYEYWYNRPVKVMKDRDGNLIEEEVAWSQKTADCIVSTLDSLEKVMKKPNKYEKNARVSGIEELIKECKDRELFHVKALARDLYVQGPDKELGFERSQTTNVPSAIHSLVDQKHLTKRLLKKAGLPVAEGSIFTEYEDALSYLKEASGPLVVKPAVGLNGSGVSVDIRSASALKAAWSYAKKFHDEIVIEELIIGVDLRVLVIGGKGKAAYIRLPANIKGDGKHTVEALIDKKNKMRLKHPHLRKSLIIPDAYTSSFLGRQGYNYKSVVPKDEIVFLQLKANISKGGDSVNITEYIHPDLLKLAEEAVAVFNLKDYCGLDLLVEDIYKPRTEQKCTVIELNSTANLEGVKHPLYGVPFDAAKALMDHLFGEKQQQQPYPAVHKEVYLCGAISSRFSDWLSERIKEYDVSAELEVQWKCAKVFLSGKEHKVNAVISEISELNNYLVAIVDGIRVSDGKEVQGEELKVRIPFNKIEASPKGYYRELLTKEQNTPMDLFVNEKPNTYPIDISAGNDINTQIYQQAFEKMGYEAKHLYKELFEIQNNNDHKAVGIHHSSYFCDQISDRWYPYKNLLALKGFPVENGVRFKVSEKSQAKIYVKKTEGPFIVSQLIPDKVTKTRVETYKELKAFWKAAKKQGANQMLVEKETNGIQLCLPVIKDRTAGEQVIIPAEVIGDGKSTVTELIKAKNSLRKGHPWFHNRLILIDEDLERLLEHQGVKLEDILEEGSRVTLQSKASTIDFGDTGNRENLIHPDIKKAAVDAVHAVPGLEFAYVYATVQDPSQALDNQEWVIDYIDSTPEVGRFHYPWIGEGVNLAKIVINSFDDENYFISLK